MTLLASGILTGIPEIDEQHRELFSRIDGFFMACMEGREHEQLEGLFAFLDKYVNAHFEVEEKLQRDSNYSGYEDHKRQHSEYRDKIKEIQIAFEECGLSEFVLQQLNHVLIDWLLLHIGKVDHAFAVHLRSGGVEIPEVETAETAETVAKSAPESLEVASPEESGKGEDPKIEVLLRKGLHAFARGDAEGAIQAWWDVLNLDPDNASAMGYLKSSGGARMGDGSEEDLEKPDITQLYEGSIEAAAEDSGVAATRSASDHPASVVTTSEQGEDSQEAVDHDEIVRLLKEGRIEDAYIRLQEASTADGKNEVIGKSLVLVENHLTLDYVRRLGNLDQCPHVQGSKEEIISLDLNPEQGYLLFLIDGESSSDEILAMSSLGHFQTIRYLVSMQDQGIIEFSAA